MLEALNILEKGLVRHSEITEALKTIEKDGKIKVLKSMATSMNNIILVPEPNMPAIKIVGGEEAIIKKLDTECIKLGPKSQEQSVYRLRLTMNPQRASEILEWLLANRLAIKYREGAIDDKKVFYTVSPVFEDIYEALLDLARTLEEQFQTIQDQ